MIEFDEVQIHLFYIEKYIHLFYYLFFFLKCILFNLVFEIIEFFTEWTATISHTQQCNTKTNTIILHASRIICAFEGKKMPWSSSIHSFEGGEKSLKKQQKVKGTMDILRSWGSNKNRNLFIKELELPPHPLLCNQRRMD